MGQLKIDKTDGMIFGVCSGIGKSYKIDPSIVRFIFGIGLFVIPEIAVLIYVGLSFIMPES